MSVTVFDLIDYCINNVTMGIQGGTHHATAWLRPGLGGSPAPGPEALG
jgi:hypothetical protein